jgi:hypothetical protein
VNDTINRNTKFEIERRIGPVYGVFQHGAVEGEKCVFRIHGIRKLID